MADAVGSGPTTLSRVCGFNSREPHVAERPKVNSIAVGSTVTACGEESSGSSRKTGVKLTSVKQEPTSETSESYMSVGEHRSMSATLVCGRVTEWFMVPVLKTGVP